MQNFSADSTAVMTSPSTFGLTESLRGGLGQGLGQKCDKQELITVSLLKHSHLLTHKIEK